ncbi:MAG: helix-turn-helix domain-containing protein [Chitinophagales bacterium]|nr:helix-turn-helix domain-containing protein [Bacteroidota bacterium]MBK8683060.1 helix-turn-helix domain-containing protein [Bacteroidota bacterium]
MSYGKKFKEVRRAHLLSQEEFAKKLGISRSIVSQVEIDKIKPTIDALKKMASTFNISLDYLMQDEEEPGSEVDFRDSIINERQWQYNTSHFNRSEKIRFEEGEAIDRRNNFFDKSMAFRRESKQQNYDEQFPVIPFVPLKKMQEYVTKGFENFLEYGFQKIQIPIHQTGILMAFELQSETSSEPLIAVCQKIHFKEIVIATNVVLVLKDTIVFGQVYSVSENIIVLNDKEYNMIDVQEIWLYKMQIQSGNNLQQVHARLNNIESLLQGISKEKSNKEKK